MNISLEPHFDEFDFPEKVYLPASEHQSRFIEAAEPGLDYSYLDLNSRADLGGSNECMTGPGMLVNMMLTDEFDFPEKVYLPASEHQSRFIEAAEPGLDYSYLDLNSRADLGGSNECMTGPGLDYSYLDLNSRADLGGSNECMTGPGMLVNMMLTAGSLYFHFTSGPNLDAIKRCGYIKQSLDDISDAVAGKGVYLTKTPPYGRTKEQIAMEIYTTYHADQKIREGKLDRCIGVWLKDSDVKHVNADGRDIFVYPEDLDLLELYSLEYYL